MRRPSSPLPAGTGPLSKGREHDLSQAHAKGRNQRSNRCGSCAACRAQDCGRCKNCRDKPRFGGPGIKKKACLARICHRADEIGSDDDAATVPLDTPSSVASHSPSVWPSRRASREEAPDDGDDGADADECRGEDGDPAVSGCDSPTISDSKKANQTPSARPSQLSSPAIRPCSPPHEVRDAHDARLPPSPPVSQQSGPSGFDACSGVDVLSLMASRLPSG